LLSNLLRRKIFGVVVTELLSCNIRLGVNEALRRLLLFIREGNQAGAVTPGYSLFHHHPPHTMRSRDEGLMHIKQIFLRSATMKINRSESTPGQTSTTVNVMKSASDLRDHIRRRAYELYEQRGSNDGHEVSDWLQAEAEVAQKLENAARTGREPLANVL
jgi:Protein of unknown function (DUF2934)